jgi:hypothetical protein
VGSSPRQSVQRPAAPWSPRGYVEGTFPFAWVVDPTVHGVSCRVRFGSVHATKRIRWRLVSLTNLFGNGGPTVVDHAPDGVRFYS